MSIEAGDRVLFVAVVADSDGRVVDLGISMSGSLAMASEAGDHSLVFEVPFSSFTAEATPSVRFRHAAARVGCGRCAVPSTGSLLTLRPGDSCPLPDQASVILDGVRLDRAARPSWVRSLRRELVIELPSDDGCSRPTGDPPRPLTFEMIGTATSSAEQASALDRTNLRKVAMTSRGDVAALAIHALAIFPADGEMSMISEPFEGPIIGGVGVGDRFVVASRAPGRPERVRFHSLTLDGLLSHVTGADSDSNRYLTDAMRIFGGFGSELLIFGQSQRTLGQDLPYAARCELIGQRLACRPFVTSHELDAERSALGVQALPGGRGIVVIREGILYPAAESGDSPIPELGVRVDPSRPTLTLSAYAEWRGRFYVCGDDDESLIVASVAVDDLFREGPASDEVRVLALASDPSCAGFERDEGPGGVLRVWTHRGVAYRLDESGEASRDSSARLVDGEVQRDLGSIEGERSTGLIVRYWGGATVRLLNGRPAERLMGPDDWFDAGAVVPLSGDQHVVIWNGPDLRAQLVDAAERRAVTNVALAVPKGTRALAGAFDDTTRRVLLAGRSGDSKMGYLAWMSVDDFRLDQLTPPSDARRIVGVSRLDSSRFVAVGDEWQLFEVRGGSVTPIPIAWDDPDTELEELEPPMNAPCFHLDRDFASSLADHERTWRAVDAKGGVGMAVGCEGTIVRIADDVAGIRATRLAMPEALLRLDQLVPPRTTAFSALRVLEGGGARLVGYERRRLLTDRFLMVRVDPWSDSIGFKLEEMDNDAPPDRRLDVAYGAAIGILEVNGGVTVVGALEDYGIIHQLGVGGSPFYGDLAPGACAESRGKIVVAGTPGNVLVGW